MRTLFKLRRNKQNRGAAAIIYCRIKVDGIHSNDFSTFIKVLPREWNSEGQRVKGNTVAATDINLLICELVYNKCYFFFIEERFD